MKLKVITNITCGVLAALHATLPSQAAGPIGVDGGWVIDNSGNCLLTSSQCSAYTANGVGWLRVNMRLVNGHTTWDSTMLGYYDTAINNARAAGIQCVILMGGEAWTGGQSSWNANNHENNSSANGDNAYIDNFVTGAVNPIVAHFHDRAKVYEIWNEPSTWSTHSGSTYSGGTFMYPSCYSWLLTKSWQQVHKVLGYTDCTVISGGIFGTTDLASSDPNYVAENSGASWLSSVFRQGTSSAVNSFASNRASYGVYPADGYGQHIYIDFNVQTTTANVSTYGNAVRNAYTAYDTGKATWVTEFGWNTSFVSQSVQAANLTTTFNWCNVGATSSYVKYASWFNWKDGGAGDFGLLDGNNNRKTSYGNFGNEANYQGRTASNNGGVNNNILNYFNSHGGQAVLGNPYNAGSGAYVRHSSTGVVPYNCQNYDGASSQSTLLLVDGPHGTYQINNLHGFWDYYRANGLAFGAPRNDEYATASGTQQDFSCGSLAWNSTSSAITWTQGTNGPIADGLYKIVNFNSGLVMDCDHQGTTNGTQILQYTYLNQANQHWAITNIGNGYYQIIGQQSGKSLDVYRGNSSDGTKIELWDYNQGPGQTWTFNPGATGNYLIVPACATGSCLGVNGGSTSPGADVLLWSQNGHNDQQWSFQAP